MRATSKSAVLLQWRNECFRPIGFHSAISWQITFTSTAHNLAVIRIVLLKFQHLLKGAELEIWSDKKRRCRLASTEDASSTSSSLADHHGLFPPLVTWREHLLPEATKLIFTEMC
jgi:hypothetical protein